MELDEVLAVLRQEVEECGSQQEWARRAGVAQTYVSQVLKGKQRPGPTILDALGIEKVTQYKFKRK